MKKIALSLFTLLLIVLAAAIIIPFAYKDKISDLAKTELNKHINAEVDFEDIHLSLFKHFPQLNVRIKQLEIKGKNLFASDTLIAIEHIDISLNLWSVFNQPMEVKAIYIQQPTINALVAHSGKTNWDISLPTDAAKQNTENDAEETFRIALNKVEVSDLNLCYADSSMDLFATMKEVDLQLSGNFSSSKSLLQLQIESPAVNVEMDNIPYLSKRSLSYTADIATDLDQLRFDLKNNEMRLQDLQLQWQGFVQLMPNDSYNLDLSFQAAENTIAQLLSLIPFQYQAPIQEVESRGNVQFSGFAKGTYGEHSYPQFEIKLKVNEAYVKYPDMPLAIEHIAIDAQVENHSSILDNTIIKVPTLQWQIGNAPFKASLESKTPISNPYLALTAQGEINLAKLADAYPIAHTQMQGKIAIKNFNTQLHLADIAQENYQNIDAQGEINLSDIRYTNTKNKEPIDILQGHIQLSPKQLTIKNLETNLQHSDFTLNGHIDNVFAYIFNHELLKGIIDIEANKIDANALMAMNDSEETAETTTLAEESSAETFDIPKNLDLSCRANIKQLIYNNLEINNIKGKLNLVNGKAELKPLQMHLLGSTIECRGSYLATDKQQANTDMQLKIIQLDVAKAASTFLTIKELFPIAKNAKGLVDIDMQFRGLLDGSMAPILSSINGKGKLNSQAFGIKSPDMTQHLSHLLPNINNTLSLKDIAANFNIIDGKFEIKSEPFKIEQFLSFFLGFQGLDQSIDYSLNIDIPKNIVAADVLGDIGKQLNVGELINAKLNITGSLKQPRFSLGFGSKGKSLQTIAEEAIDNTKAEAIAKAKAEAARLTAEANSKGGALIAAAEKQASQLKNEAQQQADKLQTETNQQIDKLINKAGNNPIAKAAAKKAGEKLKNNSEQQIQKILNNANKKADNLIDKAKEQKQQLLKSAQQEGDNLIKKAES